MHVNKGLEVGFFALYCMYDDVFIRKPENNSSYLLASKYTSVESLRVPYYSVWYHRLQSILSNVGERSTLLLSRYFLVTVPIKLF
jgi:hypothetical protein